MTIILLLIMKISNTGVLLHEILGISVFLLFILHKIFNFKWINTVTKLFIKNKVTKKTKFMYFLDIALLIIFIGIIITGIMISQKLFPYLALENTAYISKIHHFLSYLGLVLISIHIGMHTDIIMSKIERAFNINKQSEIKKFVYGIFTAAISLLGLSSTLKQPFYTNIVAPFTNDAEVKDTSKNSIEVSSDETVTDKPTLEEYLGNRICTGCSHHCSLDAIRCGRGTAYVNEATNEYNDKYQTVASATTDTNIFDYIYFMGFITMGTHYVLKVKKNKTGD